MATEDRWHDFAEAAETERKIDYDKLNAENRRLKEMMPKYKEFIEDEDYRKKLVACEG